jgi:hypothetical protein
MSVDVFLHSCLLAFLPACLSACLNSCQTAQYW